MMIDDDEFEFLVYLYRVYQYALQKKCMYVCVPLGLLCTRQRGWRWHEDEAVVGVEHAGGGGSRSSCLFRFFRGKRFRFFLGDVY